MNPSFPIYIVSKGRFESRLTSRAFETMGVPYSIVVEQQEYKSYCAVIDPAKVLVLDPAYQRNYDTFSDLGVKESTGSGPARNFVWDHAIAAGAPWHWVVDDNISGFYRWNKNLKVPVSDGTIFKAMEDFVLRYQNVAMAGPNYFMFASRKTKAPPLNINTRIYSCNLIRNDVPFRWRGRYNEDTDLSLRMLKAQWCTILFNAFLQMKSTTLQMKGGNTDTIYKAGTLAKSQMLVDMHPDVARLAWRYGRAHHFVDYSGFRSTALVRREGVAIPTGVNDYGMKLVPFDNKRKRAAPTGATPSSNAGEPTSRTEPLPQAPRAAEQRPGRPSGRVERGRRPRRSSSRPASPPSSG